MSISSLLTNSRFRRGQGMTELALGIPILIVIIAGMIDLSPLIFNFFVGKQMSARGARAAAVYYPDGSRTCYGDVLNAVGPAGGMAADFTVSGVSGVCNGDPNWAISTGTPITVEVTVDYYPLFFGGFGFPPKDTVSVWSFVTSTTDQAR